MAPSQPWVDFLSDFKMQKGQVGIWFAAPEFPRNGDPSSPCSSLGSQTELSGFLDHFRSPSLQLLEFSKAGL